MNIKLNLKPASRLMQSEIVLIDNDRHEAGVITQVFLHPFNGGLLGFALQLENHSSPLLITVRYFLFTDPPFENEQAAVLTDSFTGVEEFGDGATTYQDILGAEIITDGGQFCGQVEEVYFDEERLQTVYQVKKSGLRGWFSRTFFVVGSDCNFYSHRHRRLRLSPDAQRFKSLAAAAECLSFTNTASFFDTPYPPPFPSAKQSRP